MTRHHIHKREGPRGVSWHAVVDLGPDSATGKRRQKRLSAPTRKELEAKIADLIGRASRGEAITSTRLTVGEFLADWLDAKRAQVRVTTIANYDRIIRLHLVPVLGALPLGKVTPLHVQRSLTRAAEAGLTPPSVRMVLVTLRAAMRQALAWGLITRDPTAGVVAPRASATMAPVRAWTPEQARAFLGVAERDDHAALWRIALTTGLRRGELLGLRWADVDLSRGVLAVRRQLTKRPGGGMMEAEPKTGRARTVALSPESVAVLSRHRVRQLAARLAAGSAWRDQDLVFADGQGRPLGVELLRGRLGRLSRQAGVPVLRFHDLRHTAATLMLAAGEHPKIVSERLGHSSIDMTMDRYSHVTPDMQREAAGRLERLLDPEVEGHRSTGS